MRVALYITERHQELYEEIKSTPAKHRAERLRLLASIGLLAMRSAWSPLTLAGGQLVSVPPNTSGGDIARDRPDPRRAKLKGKLQRSLGS